MLSHRISPRQPPLIMYPHFPSPPPPRQDALAARRREQQRQEVATKAVLERGGGGGGGGGGPATPPTHSHAAAGAVKPPTPATWAVLEVVLLGSRLHYSILAPALGSTLYFPETRVVPLQRGDTAPRTLIAAMPLPPVACAQGSGGKRTVSPRCCQATAAADGSGGFVGVGAWLNALFKMFNKRISSWLHSENCSDFSMNSMPRIAASPQPAIIPEIRNPYCRQIYISIIVIQ